MKRFIAGENRSQSTLFPESLDDYIAEDNAIWVVDAFVNEPSIINTQLPKRVVFCRSS